MHGLQHMNQSISDLDLDKLIYALEKATILCSSPKELIARLERIWEDPCSTEAISRLLEISLSADEQTELEKTVHCLISTSENLPSKIRARVDRKLKRLILALPDDNAREIAISFLEHPRRPRRGIGYEVLKYVGVNEELGRKLILRFQETGEQEHLELIARSAYAVPKLDYLYLIENLTDRYWRMRIIEALLQAEGSSAFSLAHKYPFEFTYASGRLRLKTNLPTLRALLHENREDLEFLSIYAWTVGRIEAREELEELRNDLERQIEKYASSG
jgi:hypothetical protein